MNALGVLIVARGLIAQHGWTQFRCGSEEGGFCLFGAVYEASVRVEDDSALANEIRVRALCLINRFGIRDESGSVVGWNDSPGQSIEAVLKALDDTVDALQTAQSAPE